MQYSPRHSMIYQCIRRVTHLIYTGKSFHSV